MPLFDATMSILEKSMDVRLDRQNLLASDLANANTPGYEAKDLDFDKAMNSAALQLEQNMQALHMPMGSQYMGSHVNAPELVQQNGELHVAPLAMGERPMSLSIPSPALPAPEPLTKSDGILSLDGNRVDTDHAMVALGANAINYGASAKAIAKKLSILAYVANDGQG